MHDLFGAGSKEGAQEGISPAASIGGKAKARLKPGKSRSPRGLDLRGVIASPATIDLRGDAP
jgi:hypothetical protein